MKKLLKIRFVLFVFIYTIIGCKKECQTNIIQNNSNIPSHIIVKEKSISGNFDSITYELNLFNDNDSTFFDSMSVSINNSLFFPIHFNYSRFLSNNYLYYEPLNISDDDTIANALFFSADKKHLTEINNAFVINRNQPFYVSHEASFRYDANHIIYEYNYGFENNTSTCNTDITGSNGVYYTNVSSNDSLVIISEVASCNANWNEHDTIIVNFLPTNNNSNLQYLSYPAIPSLTGYMASNNLGFFEYIPLPNLNGKLIDNVYYSRNGFRYTNSYTFDANNRVKTAKVYYFDKAREELIEFNY